jgi:hypothetical protein
MKPNHAPEDAGRRGLKSPYMGRRETGFALSKGFGDPASRVLFRPSARALARAGVHSRADFKRRPLRRLGSALSMTRPRPAPDLAIVHI